MLRINSLLLKWLLTSADKAKVASIFGKMDDNIFEGDRTCKDIFTLIKKQYSEGRGLPPMEVLKTIPKDQTLLTHLESLDKLELSPEVDGYLLLELAKDTFIQKITLQKIQHILPKIPYLTCAEVKQYITNIVIELEALSHDSSKIILPSDYRYFSEDSSRERLYLGVSNDLDQMFGGVARTEFVLIGGTVGSGKSIVCCNIVAQQIKNKKTGLLFTIEMRHEEMYNRILSILSGLPFVAIHTKKLTLEQEVILAKTLLKYFYKEDFAADTYKYIYSSDFCYKDFQKKLKATELCQTHNLVVIDNPMLTMADIDVAVQRVKQQYGDGLAMFVVDYVNAIQVEDIFDWKSQMANSAGLKNIARREDVVGISPYQIDDKGKARLSKGILDKADIAMTLEAKANEIVFHSAKTRNTPPFSISTGMTWDCVTLNPANSRILELGKKGDKKEEDDDDTY